MQKRKSWIRHHCCAKCMHLNDSGDNTYCMQHGFAVSKQNTESRVCNSYTAYANPDSSDTDVQQLVGYRKVDVGIPTYVAESEHYITGRGLVFVIDLKDYPNQIPKLGNEIRVNDKLYVITGIESITYSTRVGLKVREITNET